MSLEVEFEAAVTRHFLTLTPALDEELTAVSNATHPGSTRFLAFEYDSPHFGTDFSVSVWPMDGDGMATGPGHWLLRGKAVAVPTETYDDPKYDSIEPWEMASGLLEHWISARWKAVRAQSGLPAALPAFIAHHDSYFKTDLETGTRLGWDELLGKLRA